jgi:hypothetical protein
VRVLDVWFSRAIARVRAIVNASLIVVASPLYKVFKRKGWL